MGRKSQSALLCTIEEDKGASNDILSFGQEGEIKRREEEVNSLVGHGFPSDDTTRDTRDAAETPEPNTAGNQETTSVGPF